MMAGEDGASPPPPGREQGWMRPEDRYMFDVQGFLVVRGILSPEQVAACNAALDARPETIEIRGKEARLDGRFLEGLHESAKVAWGEEPSPGLTGTHGRGDISLDLTYSPFKELVALPAAVRYMLGLVGPEVRFQGAGGMLQTEGAEGLILHNGNNPDGTEPDDAIDRRQQQFYRWEASAHPWLQMRTGQIGVNYALTPAGGGKGGFCCIPGSHKGNLPCPLELRRLESAASAAVIQPVLEPGDAVIFAESCASLARLCPAFACPYPHICVCHIIVGHSLVPRRRRLNLTPRWVLPQARTARPLGLRRWSGAPCCTVTSLATLPPAAMPPPSLPG